MSKGFDCDLCDYTCVRKWNLERHINKNHVRNVEQPTICPYCNSKCLKSHIDDCSKKMAKTCIYCGKLYQYGQSKIRHQHLCPKNPANRSPEEAPIPIMIPPNHTQIPLTNTENPYTKVSYIYLIREREFITANQHVYKVGRTTQDYALSIKRFLNYKKDSEIKTITQVKTSQVCEIEKTVIQVFKQHFIRHNDGLEYFIGDWKQMREIINTVCDKYEKENQIHTIPAIKIDAPSEPQTDLSNPPPDLS